MLKEHPEKGSPGGQAALPSGPSYAWGAVLGAAVLGAIVWLVPTLFADASAARGVVVSILIGVAAVLLAVFAVRTMNAEAGSRAFWRALSARGPSRRPRERETARAGLPRAAPGEAEAADLSWPQTDLSLAGVDLRDATLTGANLNRTEMTGASLRGASLKTAQMRHSDLAGVDLGGADLRSADLSGSSLVGASLEDARLERANLRGANLRDADLGNASLKGALYDDDTDWPAEKPPADLGLVYVKDPA